MPDEIPPTIRKKLTREEPALRQVRACWKQTSCADAKQFAQGCLERAEGLAAVCTQYLWGDRVSEEDLKFALEMLDDLIDMAYSMMEDWWDEDELIRRGWRPPKREEVRT